MKGEGTYLQNGFSQRLLKYHDEEGIKTIVECGSRDCLDAVDLFNAYHPDVIFSFECNPESIPVCKNNIWDNLEDLSRIVLVEKAVAATSGQLLFYPTDMEKSIDKNIGASSMLLHRDNEKEFFQKRIVVPAIRLDEFMNEENIAHIDLLCLAMNGYEPAAIIGLGKRNKDVSFIISEISERSFYHGDMLRDNFFQFMRENGFYLQNVVGANALFKNKNL